MLSESDLENPGKLLDALRALLNSPETLESMSTAARTQAHPHAAERIADRLAELAR
jgi:UDP-N-acetylglucosamine--N-acetylmuramyl-(pentapeptide) pyrophosphoryl-undecaprenol N-acetylglucosamine transferase